MFPVSELMGLFDGPRLALSLALSIIAGGLAFWQGALTASGWAAAVVVGTLTAGLGGWDWGMLVIVFFASSSALSRFGERRKAKLAVGQWEKGSRRDWGQVFANGGIVSALAVLQSMRISPWPWAAALGVLGTVTADTWATEIGVLSRSQPRLITTGRRVAAGTSGGITLLGSCAALSGAALIGLSALALGFILYPVARPWALPAALVGGVAGVICDSLLGATLQAIYRCPQCGAETERRLHSCGTATVKVRGWPWLNNDAVNALSSVAGAAVALVVALAYRAA